MSKYFIIAKIKKYLIIIRKQAIIIFKDVFNTLSAIKSIIIGDEKKTIKLKKALVTLRGLLVQTKITVIFLCIFFLNVFVDSETSLILSDDLISKKYALYSSNLSLKGDEIINCSDLKNRNFLKSKDKTFYFTFFSPDKKQTIEYRWDNNRFNEFEWNKMAQKIETNTSNPNQLIVKYKNNAIQTITLASTNTVKSKITGLKSFTYNLCKFDDFPSPKIQLVSGKPILGNYMSGTKGCPSVYMKFTEKEGEKYFPGPAFPEVKWAYKFHSKNEANMTFDYIHKTKGHKVSTNVVYIGDGKFNIKTSYNGRVDKNIGSNGIFYQCTTH